MLNCNIQQVSELPKKDQIKIKINNFLLQKISSKDFEKNYSIILFYLSLSLHLNHEFR